MSNLSKDDALQIAVNYERNKIKNSYFSVSNKSPGSIFNVTEECWYVSPPSDTTRIGASRVIAISKESGKILFDGFVGE